MKIKHIIPILITGILYASCDYLDYDESAGYQKDGVFHYFDRARQAQIDIYTHLPSDFGSIDGSMRAAGTDEAAYVWPASSVHWFNNGSWSAILTIDDVWRKMYTGIRSANIYLENYRKDFPELQYNKEYEDIMDQYQYYPYEARFLRAFFHFELVKRYKSIPIVTKVYTPEEINSIQTSDFEAVINFIVKECDEIAGQLPLNFASVKAGETGRATRGAVLALKARALLYAASPLFNTSGAKDKWEAAARAANDLIQLSDQEGLYQITNEEVVNNLSSKELIFETRQGDTNDFEKLNFPIGYEGGKSGISPSQNLVDAFEMKDGTAFDWNNPDHVANIYNPDQRDPRLFKTILTNGSIWKKETVETFVGGRNGQPISGATLTSYYLKKYLVENVNLNPDNPTTARHVWVLFRYSEVLLNYAEALFEAKGSATYTDSEFALSPLGAVNKIRARAGMPNIGEDNFMNKLRNERRVELAFEDHRFWDVRRWKIADKLTDIYGVRIVKNADDTYTYTRQLVEKRVWQDKMYLYPISNNELFNNPNLKQNTGW